MEDIIEYIRLLLCADYSILLPWIGWGIAIFFCALLLFVIWIRSWNKVWWKKKLPTIMGWGAMLALPYAATGIVKDVSVELRRDENAYLLRKAIRDKIERGITTYRALELLNEVKKDQNIFVELCKKVYEKRIVGGFSLKANIDKMSISSESLMQVEKHLENLKNNIRYDNYFRGEFEKHRHQITEGVVNIVAKSQREKNLDSIKEGCHLNPWRTLLPLGVIFMILSAWLAVKDIQE